MKRKVLNVIIGLILLTMVGCSGETTTELVTQTPTTEVITTESVTQAPTTVEVFDNYITLVVGDDTRSLGYNDDQDVSVLDLIEASDILIEYSTSEYGALVSAIGSFEQDDFHWIGFTKNSEFAMSGIDSIEYTDGDVFEFTENLASWETNLEVELLSSDQDDALFSIGDYTIQVAKSELSVPLFVGESYLITGTPQSEDNQVITMSLTDLSPTSYTGYIEIKLGDDDWQLMYDEQSVSVLDIIEASDIVLEYSTSEYGAMVSAIGSFQQDDFHWIGFTKNDEFAMSGIDSIDYTNGDVFEFTENLVSWDTVLEVELSSIDQDYALFSIGEYTIQIAKSDLSDPLFVGESYLLTGTPQSEDNQVITMSLSGLNPVSYTGYIEIKLGDDDWQLMYDEQNVSVLEIIEASDIVLEYSTSEYGAMVSAIGPFEQDDFHWIGFTKNDEFAMSGIDSIDYTNGDVFEFTESLVSWQISLGGELTSTDNNELLFVNENQSFIVREEDLPREMTIDDFVVGFIYHLTGSPSLDSNDSVNIFLPTNITLTVINDFTDLYDIEIGDVFILEFTVTSFEGSSEFGFELFADDINGLSSTDISENMLVSSNTDYIFYSIPDGYNLSLGQTYIGRFIYQINAPSSVPQITVYEESVNGDSLTDIIVEK